MVKILNCQKLENINVPFWIEHIYIYAYEEDFDSSNIKVPFGCKLHIETENIDYSYWNLDENYEYSI